MTHRSNWRECQSQVSTLFNFKWQQNLIGLDFASLSKLSTIKQTVNHFEFHPQISNKCNLFINLTKYCESRGLEVFNYIPFTVIFQYDSVSYTSEMENLGNLYNNIKDFIAGVGPSPKLKKYNTMFSLINTGNEKIGSKTSIMLHPNHYDGKNFWIVKACNLNRGRCIKMADSFPKIQKLVKKFYEGITTEYTNENEEFLLNPNLITEDEKKKLMMNKYRTNSVVVQKYLEKPLLYKGRKFDIRIWVLITQKFEVLVFKEGHLKTSSVPYDINLTSSYVHITNYSIQKYNGNFSKFEDGNEVSFTDFQNFINEEYSGKEINVRNIFSKIKNIIELTCRAVSSKINLNCRQNCFEIFGYDFIMDVDFNVFLLEVNTNPGLEESSPLIKTLVPRMLDDALRITIDDIYETKYSFTVEEEEGKPSSYYSPFPVEGYLDTENLWEFICDLNEKEKNLPEEGKKKKKKKKEINKEENE